MNINFIFWINLFQMTTLNYIHSPVKCEVDVDIYIGIIYILKRFRNIAII